MDALVFERNRKQTRAELKRFVLRNGGDALRDLAVAAIGILAGPSSQHTRR
jgi:hypothetical protein